MMTVRLGTLFVIFKLLSCGLAEESPCTPGFESKLLVFKVHKDHLHRGERLGRVIFNTCDGRTGIHFQSTDQGIDLSMDGTLMLTRSVILHEGLKEFSVSAWDSSGKKHTASVRVEHVRYHEDPDMESPSDDLALTFPKSSMGLKRAKRGWIIPPITVPENSRGLFPMRLARISSDHASETRMSYKITGEGADQDPKGIFTIDRLSGWVSVTQPLDREKKAFYELVAHATGVDVNIVEKPMEIIISVIDQNDNKPVFIQNPFNGNVPEAAEKGKVFMMVTATDADDKVNTNNADISYSIVSQDPPSPKPNMFAINPASGAISVLETGLDRKQWSRYTLVIMATDMNGEGGSTTGTAVITVSVGNDKTPQRGWIIPPISVPENSKGPFPMKLLQIRSDYASETRLAYKITGEGADLDPKGIFTIDRLSGWVSVTQQLDREKKSSYKLVAHATGVDADIVEKPVEIIVTVTDQNDNRPVFTQNPFHGNVRKTAGKGEVFMTVTATDADDKENTDNADISYSIVSQFPPSPKPNMFAINPVSGAISVLETGLDRKQWSIYTLAIKAADMNGEGLSTTATAVITVTDSKDNTPLFGKGWIIPPISVTENSKGPFPVRLVQIKSVSASETQMAYRITGEGADQDPKGIFQIDRLSGWISVTQQLDRDNKDSYRLVAHANSVDGRTAEKPVEIVVNVIDQNDNKPVFTQNHFNGSVHEAAEKGEVFMTVIATDADDKENTDNADIRYSIVSQDPPSPKPNMFAINPVSGGISVLETGLDRKQWSSYTLVIKAADMNGEGLSTTATAVITVTDSKDNTPQFERGWIIPPINVLENSKGPFPERLVQIRSAYASEIQMSYKITGEGADLDPKGIFTIDRLSGWVSVTQPLDRENKDSYKLVAHATGVDVNIVEKPTEIVVTVTDQNDNKPVFTQNLFSGNVPEALERGEVFLTVTATDADDKGNTDNADISYTIVSQDPPSPKPNMFAINPVSGAISVLETGLDRKQWSRYTLVIKATDMNGEGLSTTATAVITVTDAVV